MTEIINYRGRFIDVAEFLKNVLETVPTAKIQVDINELKKNVTTDIFTETNLASFNEIETVDDFNRFITLTSTKLVGVKALLNALLSENNLSFKENVAGNLRKDHVALIFRSLFDFIDTASTTTTTPQKVEVVETPPPKIEKPPKKIELSLSEIQTILNGCKFVNRGDIDVTDFLLTEKKPVTLNNDFYLIIPRNLQIYEGAVAVVTQNTHDVAAVGNLQRYDGKIHILLKTSNIDYNLFRKQSNFEVVLFPITAQENFERGEHYAGEVYVAECIINLQQLAEARSTLCIDFGTSNTTVGTYSVKNPDSMEPEIVEFIDETDAEPVMRKMLPTVVYVESCAGDKVKYLFGYDALRRVIEMDYKTTASVFYEIKRWITTINETENVTDEAGHTKYNITHREIIQAYIEHVLNLSEQYFEHKFKTIHFTAPVKLKDSFIEEMRAMFNKDGRNIWEAGLSIDEGIAIIYNHISEQRKKNKLGTKPETVLIMDCGGGTTDLASCRYSLNNSGYSSKLDIVTKFENGDSNFGGNNVTFRILQLLKIKLAHRLNAAEDFSVKGIIADENDILKDIDDEKSADEIYSKFNAEYEKAEEFVPTKFAGEKLNKRKGDLKRNYYYLWQMAEAYKIQFYRNMDFVTVNFDDDNDKKIGIPDDNKYYLFVKNTATGELYQKWNPMSGIEITNNEIHRLLYADIYSLLKTVLYAYDSSDDEQELLKYTYYKLSGQSCKITLFNELLKEFIPGKYLRYRDEKAVAPDSVELKLACIKGSVYYVRDKEYGEIKPYITMETPKLIYDVCKVDVDDKIKVTMLERGVENIDPEVDVISSDAVHVKYIVVSQTGKRHNTIVFAIDKKHLRESSTPEIEADIARHTNDEDHRIGKSVTDKLVEIDLSKEGGAVYALFAVPSKTGYGFYIYCIRVQPGSPRYHFTQEPKYYSFEDNSLDTFFDGSR